MISIDLYSALPFLPPADFELQRTLALQALETLTTATGSGSNLLGWLHLPQTTPPDELQKIKEVARDLSTGIDTVIVIGIGGSYLGAKAIIEALSHSFDLLLPQRKHPIVLFAGHHISEDYFSELLDIMHHRSCACIVISKSGTTTEPAIAFRLIKKFIEEKYGKEEAKRRIVAITDAFKGALRSLSSQEGYRTFIIPDDVGGRFSVLTDVGLVSSAFVGINIRAMLKGAADMRLHCDEKDLMKNPAMIIALSHVLYMEKGKNMSVMMPYSNALFDMADWYRQLWAESIGKRFSLDKKEIRVGQTPVNALGATDQHSQVQLYAEGPHDKIFTFIMVENY